MRAGAAGASGYVGSELVRLLSAHPSVRAGQTSEQLGQLGAHRASARQQAVGLYDLQQGECHGGRQGVAAAAIASAGRDHGVIVNDCQPDVVRLAPPLVWGRAELADAAERLPAAWASATVQTQALGTASR